LNFDQAIKSDSPQLCIRDPFFEGRRVGRWNGNEVLARVSSTGLVSAASEFSVAFPTIPATSNFVIHIQIRLIRVSCVCVRFGFSIHGSPASAPQVQAGDLKPFRYMSWNYDGAERMCKIDLERRRAPFVNLKEGARDSLPEN
jgi:hypothetical protein